MVSHTSITDDQTTDRSVANKNLALNSIVGAAFGGALNLAYRGVQEGLTRSQPLVNVAWHSPWVSEVACRCISVHPELSPF